MRGGYSMKVLDVQGLQTGIDDTIKDIGNFQDQITSVQKAVRGVTSLDDALKGKGGDAIRAFYNDCHQPLLVYMNKFLADYKETLEETKQAVQSFEAGEKGFIRQEFLENDVENGLQKVEDVTTGLTDEANSIMKSVNDIVSLPQLDPEEVLHHVQRGKKKTRETVEQLHELDNKQTKALESIEQELTTMKNYVTEREGKIRNGDISISEYDRSTLKNNDVYNEVLGEVNPMHSALNKMENIYAYIDPYMIMLQPQRMFPITYRDHEVSKTPVDLSSVKNADTYRKLAHENQATDVEEAALEKYLLGVESGDSNNTFDPDDLEDLEDLDDRPMGYWDKVKVQGGNSRLSGTPDGFAGPATATFDYFSEDLFTMF